MREQWWQLTPGVLGDPVRLTWPVSPEALRELKIYWPSTYAWKPRKIYGEQLTSALRRYVDVQITDLPQPYQGVINFELSLQGRRYKINIETSDYPELNEDAYEHADLHFKMEFLKDGYGPRDRLLPGGYINADSVVYAYLPRLRRLRDRVPPKHEVYGRYSLSMEKRRAPLEILRGSNKFAFYGGEGKVRYSRYLTEVAQSKVCIDLPSMSSVTWRMIDYLAIGTCIVGPPHTCQMQFPFIDKVHVAYCRPDYSDLEEVCEYYVQHGDEREALVRNSRAFFDAYLHRDQLASYYLHHCLQRFAAGIG